MFGICNKFLYDIDLRWLQRDEAIYILSIKILHVLTFNHVHVQDG